MHFGRLLIMLHGMNLHATQRCDKRQYSSTAVRFPIVNDISNLHIITSSGFSRAYAHARTRKGVKAPATILPAKKPYFWIGHCLTVFRWQAGGSRGQRLSLDSSRSCRRFLIATLSIFIGIAMNKHLHDLLLSSNTLFIPTHPTLSKRLGHYLSASALKCCSIPIRLSPCTSNYHRKAPATILPAKKPYFWIGHCLTVFRWQAGGSRGQRLSLDSSRSGRIFLIATLYIFIGIAMIQYLPTLLLSSNTLFVPTHPTLSKRLGHYLSATAQ